MSLSSFIGNDMVLYTVHSFVCVLFFFVSSEGLWVFFLLITDVGIIGRFT